jgi:Domain of unknown function (DUF4383)
MTKTLALLFGVIFLLVGALGFAPESWGLVKPAVEHTEMNHVLLLGLFPVNTAHNIVHLLFGLWGLAASRSLSGSRTYFQAVGVIYLLLTVLAFVSPTTGGMVPIYGNDIWLHGVLAVAGLVLGFFVKDRVAVR